MNRLAQFGVRFVILGLLATAIWISKDALIQFAVVRQAERIVGAKFELDHLRFNAEDGHLFVKNLRIADPEFPLRNLLQADVAYLRFNINELLNRRFVIEEGQAKGLIFNAPRTESGALRGHNELTANPEPVATNSDSALQTTDLLEDFSGGNVQLVTQSETRSTRLSQQWLNQIPPGGNNESKHRLQAVRTRKIAEELTPKWTVVLAQAAEYAEGLPTQLAEFQQRVRHPVFPNQLRDGKTFTTFNNELAMLQLSIDTSRQNLAQYLIDLDNDRKGIADAVKSDIQQLTAATPASRFDDNLVSQILFYDHHRQLAEELVDFIQWMRDQIDHQNAPIFTNRLRPILNGLDFYPHGDELKPWVEIKQLDFEGIGHFAGQHHKFVGTAYNLTSHPNRSANPMEFHIRALGKKNISLQCILDRSQEKSIDKLEVNWPEFPIVNQRIGNPTSIVVDLGENQQLSAKINIEIQDDQVEGLIELRHNQVALWIDELSTQVASQETRQLINQNLSSINHFKSSARLSGRLDELELTVSSGLGTQLAAVAQKILVDAVQQQNETEIKNARRIAADLNQTLDQKIKPSVAAILKSLEQQSVAASQMMTELRQAEDSVWSKLR